MFCLGLAGVGDAGRDGDTSDVVEPSLSASLASLPVVTLRLLAFCIGDSSSSEDDLLSF